MARQINELDKLFSGMTPDEKRALISQVRANRVTINTKSKVVRKAKKEGRKQASKVSSMINKLSEADQLALLEELENSV